MSTKARPTTGYSAAAFEDLDTQPAPKALSGNGVGDLRRLLPDRPTTPPVQTSPTPYPTIQAPVQQAQIISAGRPGSFGTVQSNMRIPTEDAELLKRVRTELDMSSGELITTAIAELYQSGDLAPLFVRHTPHGTLFETRATRLPSKKPADTRYSIVSYRLTPTDFATLDAIQREVGARSRGKLITTAVREWVTRNQPVTAADTT